MPNYTYNEVTITAKSKKDLDIFIKQVKGNDNDFDFEKIEPMPKDIFRGNLGINEKEKYGKKNWYDWSLANWGTKWNSCDTSFERVSDTTAFYMFITAWSPPTGIYESIGNIYSGQVKDCPAVYVDWHCLDEDDDTNGEGYSMESFYKGE